MKRKKKVAEKVRCITCRECAFSVLLQYYDGNINDPLIAECHGERFMANHTTCRMAEAAKDTKRIIRIKKRRTA